MGYKVFLVEDEIVTREGIRDNVDWQAYGFEFCGEASDGELAWPLLQTARPEVLITDIKMPFMDGLQLCKLVREHLPWVKIVILSGHDEFEYAQQAIQVGVSEYLLKPITVQDLHGMLQKVAVQLAQARAEQDRLRQLQMQVEEHRAMLRERLLLRLVVGAITSAEVIEKSHGLGLDLTARYYLVTILKLDKPGGDEGFNYAGSQQVQQAVLERAESNPDAFVLKKDWEELVLLMKGYTVAYVEEERDLLLEQIEGEVKQRGYRLVIGRGTPRNRLADIHQSFVEALVGVQTAANAGRMVDSGRVDKAELLKLDKLAVARYLRSGTQEGFDAFFAAYLQPLGETALKTYLLKNYLFVEVVLSTAQLVHELGGDLDQVIPELNSIETLWPNIRTLEQLREQARRILVSALAFRDGQVGRQHAGLIWLAKEYLDRHYADPDIALNEIAAQVNLSPSHFSVVFGQETGQSFKEYLTELRLRKAKELLRTTALKSAEIAYQVGYSDPHYFSAVFRKHTGLSPTEFRSQAQPG